MKIIVIALALFVAGASAKTKLQFQQAMRTGEPRIITDQILRVIEDVSQRIVDAGFDPLIVDHESIDYALPVPSIFNVRGYVTNLLLRGASNIIVNDLTLGLLTMRVTYDISIPEIIFNVVNSELDANLFGENINVRYSGRFALSGLRTTGNVRVSVGIITGTTIREIDLAIELGGIDSQLNLQLQNVDYSNVINTFWGKTVPGILDVFASDINELLTIVGKEVIESYL